MTYVETLLGVLDRDPTAALAYCDMNPTGRFAGQTFEPEPPILGTTPYLRMMTILNQHLVAFAMRGLTRREAIHLAGPIPTHAMSSYGAPIAWIAGLARWGTICRVPQVLYWKRYHGTNTESAWFMWPRERKLEAWAYHCVEMMRQALQVRVSVSESRLLWLAAVERLTSVATARTFVDLSDLQRHEYKALLTRFLKLTEQSGGADIARRLEMSWRELRRWTEDSYWMPPSRLVEIRAFGPDAIVAGRGSMFSPPGSPPCGSRHHEACPRIPSCVLENGN